MNRVRITNFESGGTATHLGLDYVRLHSFTRANGMRTYAAQIAIVITDGESNDAEDTAAAAERLRDKVRKERENPLRRKIWIVS